MDEVAQRDAAWPPGGGAAASSRGHEGAILSGTPSEVALLGSAPATSDQRRHAMTVAAALVLAFVATAPTASLPLPAVPAFVSAYDAAIVILDLVTAVLLYSQYRELDERCFAALACGYVFTAVVAAAHGLSFPDAFVAGSLIGGEQTTVWLGMVWHGGFALFIAAYALLARRDRARPASSAAGRQGAWATAGTVALAALAILLTTAGEALLPELMRGSNHRSDATRLILSIAWAANVGALALLLWATRGRRLIDLWLAVTLLASIIDLALSAVLVDGRYQLGYYAGRFYGLLASTFVLALLLRQAVGLYAGLARTASALRESEARLRAIYDGTYEYIGVLSPDGTLLEANRASLEFDGGKREDVVGRPFWETVWFVHTPGAPEKLRAAIARAAAGEFIRYEAPLLSPSGEEVVFDFSLHPVRDEQGEVILIVPEGRNITDRKRAEERLTAASDLVGLASYTWDPATGVLHWDARLKAMWGLPPDAPVDQALWLSAIHPGDRPQVEAALAACLDPAGDGIYRVEYRVIGITDRVERWVSTCGRTSFADGRPVGFIGAVIDTTARKSAEDAQRMLIAELQHRTRNLLAVVHSTVNQTIKASGSFEDFSALLEERLSALSRVQGLLSRGGGHSVALRELLNGELLAHGAHLDGIAITGPDVMLPSRSVQILALALHELATNAAKYGALAQEQARLAVAWELGGSAASRFVSIRWTETGVRMPARDRKGFGSYLIGRALPYELEADTSLNFAPDGVRCELKVPLAEEGRDDGRQQAPGQAHSRRRG